MNVRESTIQWKGFQQEEKYDQNKSKQYEYKYMYGQRLASAEMGNTRIGRFPLPRTGKEEVIPRHDSIDANLIAQFLSHRHESVNTLGRSCPANRGRRRQTAD